MKFAIISDIHLGQESEFKGVVRKLSRHSKRLLEKFIIDMNVDVRPEFVVNLGDLINDVEREEDIENLKYVLEQQKQLDCPVHNLVGNHEQWTLSREDMEGFYGMKPLYYSTDTDTHHLIFMLSEAGNGEDSYVGTEQLSWLQEDLEVTNKPTIVFTHHALADQDLTGNFWFEGRENRALVTNRDEVRNIFESSGKVIAVFNGHTHWNKMDVHNGIPYFTITSIVENYKNEDIPSESYAVIDVNEAEIKVDVRGNDTAQHTFTF